MLMLVFETGTEATTGDKTLSKTYGPAGRADFQLQAYISALHTAFSALALRPRRDFITAVNIVNWLR